MKKLRTWILCATLLAALICLTCTPALAATLLPGSTPQPHTHQWVLGTRLSEPTCSTPGRGVYYCSICRTQFEGEIPSLGHIWGKWNIVEQYTCDHGGKETRTCSRCNKTEIKLTPAAHKWSRWKVLEKETCGKDGLQQHTCSVCGVVETEAIPATGEHNFSTSKTVKRATCTDKGLRVLICEVCGAEEEEEIEARGGSHKWGEWKVTTPATCDAPGEETSTCSRCKDTQTRAIDPLRHDWDQGVITQPAGYLEKGVKTYTCQRCGATRTEEIPLITTMSNLPVMEEIRGRTPPETDVPKGMELKIVQDPVGGTIDYGGSLSLFVDVTGGTPPYKYEWHREYIGKSLWSAIITVLMNRTLNYDEFICYANAGNYAYSCTVTDYDGNKVTSGSARVLYNLNILIQPEHQNLYGKSSVQLYCKAVDGLPASDGSYTYTWYGPYGTAIGTSKDGKISTSQEGTHYCVVSDSAGQTRSSNPCNVYKVDPLRIDKKQIDHALAPGEASGVWADIMGGVPPYTVTWQRDYKEIPWVLVNNNRYFASITGDENKEVKYTVHVTDSMEASASADVTISYKQLKIAKQPEGGTITEGDTHPISVVMGEGEEPFKYTLYRTYQQYATGSSSVDVDKAGLYFFHIEDATGRWADSDMATVVVKKKEGAPEKEDEPAKEDAPAVGEEDGLTIVSTSFDGEITNAKTASFGVEVAGGTAPYTFTLLNDTATKDSKNSNLASTSFPIEEPGFYAIHIEDKDGKTATTAYLQAIDARLRIVQQPQSITIQYQADTYYSASFSVVAEGHPDHPLAYQWQCKTMNGWSSFNEGPKNSITVKEYTNDHTNYHLCTAYRCIVRDTVTDEKVMSDEATVSYPMTVTGGQNGTHTSILLYIRGGHAPYTITCYRRRLSFYGDREDTYVVEDYDLTGHSQYLGGDLHAADYKFTGVSRHAKKYYVAMYRYKHWSYYFTVTDMYGQSVTYRVRMQSDNPEARYLADGWYELRDNYDDV